MNILFITSSRLGDAVLSTGLLDHILRHHEGAAITVVCGPLPATLFEDVPGLEQIVILRKKSWNRHWIDLWRKTCGTRWDMIVDLRDSAVSRLLFARERFVFTGRKIDRRLHKVEQNAAVMGISPPPAPRLWLTGLKEERARALIPEGKPVLGVGPTANWTGKTWAEENFIELIRRLTGPAGILPATRVAVFAAPGEETVARRVLESVPEERRIDMIAKADPGTAAAALSRCAFYVGNDSGLMHCAAAAGTPTLGLFGPSWPRLYRPWGEKAAWVSTPQPYDRLIDFPGYNPKTTGSLMGSLSVDAVEEAARALWRRRATVPA